MASATPTRARKPLPKLAWLQPAVLVGSLLPLAVILFRGLTGRLGANPIATAMNQLGLLALIFLMVSLFCSPLKVLFGWKWPLKVRKTLGLLGFFTALAHFTVWLVLDQGLTVQGALGDIVSRPFILVGLAALMMLVPLARTSTKKALKEMGFGAWKRLHRLAYVATALGVVHFFLRVKADVTEPMIYGGVFVFLMAVRFYDHRRALQRARATLNR